MQNMDSLLFETNAFPSALCEAGLSINSRTAQAYWHRFSRRNTIAQQREVAGLDYPDMILARKPLLYNADTQCLGRL